MQPKIIDIAKIYKEKNAKAFKYTPNFLINYIKKIVHEDDLNSFQHQSGHLYHLDYCDASIAELKLNIQYTGLENIPKDGGFILASNHPLGGLDGIALIQTVGKVRKDIHFLVNDMLTNLKNFGDLFIPVNKVGANASENLRRIEKIFAGDNGTLLFPAGLVSRRNKGVIKDLEWNKSFVAKAQKYNKPIIPVLLKGALSSWFYNLSAFRKMIGIKANIEMLYLADELYKQTGKTLQITIGKPIEAKVFTNEHTPKVWASIVREYVYAMQENASLDFETFAKKYKA
jgi:putative hemolysin